ncbi:MAG: hypothetical protein JKY17_03025 [Magnetovibrio sp.]|nr:hypothetical protein [Magnetovibrio sp.]
MRLALALLFSFIILSSTQPSQAQVSGSGLPLPRFVSLRAGEVNLRTGPGIQYPVDWVYRKSGLPLQVIAEYKTWRKVMDWQGSQGWIHQTMLSAKRTFIIIGRLKTVLSKADRKARPIVKLQDSVVGRLISCPSGSKFCRIEVEGFEGWMARSDFWGVLKGESLE